MTTGGTEVPAEVFEAVLEYVNGWTWEEKQEVVERRWLELFTDDADLVMQHLLLEYEADPDAVAALTEQRSLLARAREIGIGPAFDGYLHPAIESIDPALLARLQEVDTEYDFLALTARYPTLRRVVLGAVQRLFNTPTMAGKRAILTRERALLLTPAAGFATGVMARATEGPDAEGWEWHEKLLSEVRRRGIGAVFAEADDGGAETGDGPRLPGVQAILEELAFAEQYTDPARVAELCREGLASVDPDVDPGLAAFFHERLGNALLDDRGMDRGAGIESAIEHFSTALELAERLHRPGVEVEILRGLAVAYADRRHGSRAENLRRATELCERALDLVSGEDPEETRDTRARLHFTAAQIYDTDARARPHAEQALALMDADNDPRGWAAAHLILGRLTRNDFDTPGALDAAIDHFRQAEAVLSAEEYPEDFAIVQGDHAAVLRLRSGGDRDEALEEAVERLEAGRSAISQRRQSQLYASLSSDLATTYLERHQGDPADNVEQAIAAVESALRVFTPEEFPDEWADVQVTLGKAYRRRIVGQRPSNLEAAREAFEAALTVFTRDEWPRQWADTQVNMGLVEMLRREAGLTDFVDDAVRHLNLALEALTPDADPESWAFAQANLGEAYALRGNDPNDRAASEHHRLLATRVWTRENAPEHWARIQHALGRLYARATNGADPEYRKAVAYFDAALSVQTPDAGGEDRIRTLADVAALRLVGSEWDEALRASHEAVDLATQRLAGAYTSAGRRHLVRALAGVYDTAAYSLLRLGRQGEALGWLDAGKSRLLLDDLTSGLDHSKLSATDRERLATARERVRRLETEQALPVGFHQRRSDAELGRLLAVARAELSRTLVRLSEQQPEAQPGFPQDEQAVLAAIPPGEALVEIVLTAAGGAAFVIPGGSAELRPEHVLAITADVEHEVVGVTTRWLQTYANLLLERVDLDQWNASLVETAAWIWQAVLGPVHGRLLELGVARHALVTLVPAGPLALLPLHVACPSPADGLTTFMDDFAVAYAPSANVLAVCHGRGADPTRAGRRVAVVSDPTGDLPNALLEGQAVAELAGAGQTVVLEGTAAGRDAVIRAVSGAFYVHFACHGYVNWLESDFSGLFLADGPLTATEVTSQLDLDHARLVTLSACETGIGDMGSGNEVLGLPQAFLRAGAAGVVATLWSVADDATSLLMHRFYRGLLDEGETPARALRAAQLWLRDATVAEVDTLASGSTASSGNDGLWPVGAISSESRPFAAIHYWGAFTLVGA